MIRDELTAALERDLIGPGSPEEIINDRPGDRYLTGILFPPQTRLGADQDDDAGTGGDGDSSEAEAIAGSNTLRPSTAGLSFALKPPAGGEPAITLTITGARYSGIDESDEPGRSPRAWQRRPLELTLPEISLGASDVLREKLGPYGLEGLELYIRTRRDGDLVLATAVISNISALPRQPNRRQLEEATFFQFAMSIAPAADSSLVPRPIGGRQDDEDSRIAALIYRHTAEFAVGHVCSAAWDVSARPAPRIETKWIPAAVVPGISPNGAKAFEALSGNSAQDPLSALWLATCSDADMDSALQRVVGSYRNWIGGELERLDTDETITTELRGQALENLERCEAAAARMDKGCALLIERPNARLAFRYANQAMETQRRWSADEALRWYPFQVGFALLCLESVALPGSTERETMDLLWFPTGGGKTEAYLLLTAFAIFLRRLEAPQGVAAVTVFMRYTLRLLTVQQFQRAATLICACELLRLGKLGSAKQISPALTSGPPISIGLWVGKDSTPNSVQAAEQALRNEESSTPVQLTECPCCHSELNWAVARNPDRVAVTCSNPACELGQAVPELPIWTVDEDLYRERPSLVIGTADKYAQILPQPRAGVLFGLDTGAPPTLIIQDELHLISGPLGTMAGIYEIAIDALCKHQGRRPKIIGSTATIRRAREQIRALFDRTAFQFPPPGLDHDNSGFAVADHDLPGRLYLGLTTAGRSAKFTLQAASASLLQASVEPGMDPVEADPYRSLVIYFNSLRELGGSLTLMQDDVAKSAEDFARRRVVEARAAPEVVELNSRVASSDIPKVLARLGRSFGQDGAVDVVLASNMISVGMDVRRLGLMLVNGQPKGVAEYIQATSRVGRGKTAGLVLTIYNANKARDRSHYETFQTWHQSLYRDVEATSVTPYAPRARDRALHAPLVAMSRYLVPGLGGDTVDIAGFEDQIEAFADEIVERAKRSDDRETDGVRKYLDRRLDQWRARGPVAWWNDRKPEFSLLISAEKVAAKLAANRGVSGAAWATPNSLRNVEASTQYVLLQNIDGDDA